MAHLGKLSHKNCLNRKERLSSENIYIIQHVPASLHSTQSVLQFSTNRIDCIDQVRSDRIWAIFWDAGKVINSIRQRLS